MTRGVSLAAAIVLAALCLQCGGESPGGPDPVPGPGPSPAPGLGPGPVGPPPLGSPVFVGAGDIGTCGSSGLQATAALLDTIGGVVFTAGDNAYPNGTRQNFQSCYEPTWGRHKGRTRPSPGNHDYEVPNAAAYFEYFGANAGPPGLGYYTFTVGEWLAVSLNSNVAAGPGSTQAQWLSQLLETSTARCTVAYFHHPRFGSGAHGSNGNVLELWRILYDAGADVIISGHEHFYERFAKQNQHGSADPERGIRQFIAGTGGATLAPFVGAISNSEVRISQHGVLKLTLGPQSYAWEFIGVAGASDTGFAACH